MSSLLNIWNETEQKQEIVYGENSPNSGWFEFSPPQKKAHSKSTTSHSLQPSISDSHSEITEYDTNDHLNDETISDIDTHSPDVEQIPTLKIGRFSASPWLNFGCAKYYANPSSTCNQPIEKQLNIHNPTDKDETLIVEKLTDKFGFWASCSSITVPAFSSRPFSFYWKPKSIGNVRENVVFKGSSFRLMVVLFATGTEKLGFKTVPVKIEIVTGVSETGERQMLTSSFDMQQQTDDAQAIQKSKERLERTKALAETKKAVDSTRRRPAVFSSSRPKQTAVTPKSETGTVSRLASKSLEIRTPLQTSTKNSVVASHQQTTNKRPAPSSIIQSATKRHKIGDEFKTPSKQAIQNSQTQILESAVKGLFKKYASDDRWMEKQETAFAKWLNFILTENCESGEDRNVTSRNISKPIESRSAKLTPKHMSIVKKKSAVKQAARSLFCGSESKRVLGRVAQEIEAGKLVISEDKFIYADLGLRQHVTNLLLNYAPHHLHLALETIFGEVIPGPAANCSDFSSALQSILAKFIVKRFLFDEQLAHQYEGIVKELYRPGFKEALDKLVLYRFFSTIWLLDTMKTHNILDDNSYQGISSYTLPSHILAECNRNSGCLFKRDSTVKSSTELMCIFSGSYLSGEGDIIRRMSLLGYTLRYQQSFLDEFDFTVSSLANDLRDGIRLSRLADVLSKKTLTAACMSSLRVPAISRLQKIHNVTQAMNKLRSCGVAVAEVEPRDIVDGKQGKTLLYLWHVILNAHLPYLISVEALRDEISKIERSNLIAKLDAQLKGKPSPLRDQKPTAESEPITSIFFNVELFSSILEWAKVVCARYGISVQNFTTSFSDGRAICALINYYVPELLDSQSIQHNTSTRLEEKLNYALGQDNPCDELTNEDFDLLPTSPGPIDGNWIGVFSPPSGTTPALKSVLEAEKHNYNLIQSALKKIGFVPNLVSAFDMSNTLPDEKVVVTFLTFLCARLVEVKAEREATMVIQRAFRAWYSQCSHVREAKAVIVIQKYLRGKQQRDCYQKLIWAKNVIANHFVGAVQRKKFVQMRQAAICLQSHIRTHLVLKTLEKQTNAAIVIQKYVRGTQQRSMLSNLRQAAIRIQSIWRGRQARAHVEKIRAALKIQSWWRMIQARKSFHQKNDAALKIQSWWRMIQQKKRFESLNHAALVIQTAIRAKAARVRVERIRAAIKIQSWWRMIQARKSFHQKNDATLKIQSWWRMIQARKTFHQKNDAALKIQSWWRMVQARKTFHQKSAAALKIQSWWRMIQARKAFHQKSDAALKIQSWWRMIQARKSFHEKSAAALKIQSWWRMIQQKKKFESLNRAALVIQTAIRAKAARVQVERIRAAIKIQSWWRMIQARKSFHQKNDATLKIQSWWRMVQARKAFQEKNAAALKIQSWWRMIQARKSYHQLESAAIVLQTYIRSKLARDHLRQMNQAAVTIQSWWRMIQQQRDFERTKNAAIVIQTAFRCLQAKRELELRRATLKIQSWYKMVRQRNEYTQTRLAAIAIQRAYRAHKSMVLQDRSKAALKIQSWWRMIKQQRENKLVEASVIKIQAFVRQRIEQNRFTSLKEAAVKVQSIWRGRQARAHVERIQAAIKIQSWWRMLQARKSFHQKNDAALKIQSWWRMIQARKAFHEKNTAALKIQSWWRMIQARKSFHQKNDAALKIQSWWRMIQARKSFHQKNDAALKIQSWWRMIQARKSFHQKNDAALKIQSWWRMLQARKSFHQKNDAALKIQSWWRMIQARKAFHEKNTAALKIQSWWRMIQQKKKFESLNRAALVIQTAIRAKAARVQVERIRAAIKIQSWWRMLQARKSFHQKNTAALKIQSWWRMIQARKSLHEKSTAALKIQSWWRMVQARKAFHQKNDAALKIQSWWRMIQAKRSFATLQTSAIIVQKFVRSWLVQRQLDEMTAATTKIQALYRGFKQRQQTNTIRSGIARLQALVRGQQARIQASQRINQVISAQSLIRGFLARTAYQNQLKSIILIESAARAYLARKELALRTSSAITIQAAVRSFLVHRRVQKVNALNVLVNSYKAHRLALGIEQFKANRETLSAAIRGYLARRELHSHHHQQLEKSVITIQRAYRAKLVEREKDKVENAVLRIQALYKGYRVRRDAKLAKIAELRKKIEHSRATTPISQSLGYKTNVALKVLLEGTKLTDIMSACTVLEQSTRYSDKCAMYVIEVEAIKILFGVMETCNRSAPHISMLKIILDVICHILYWTATRSGLVSQQPDVLERLVNIMMTFKDVPEVFIRASKAFSSILKPLPQVGLNWIQSFSQSASSSTTGSKMSLGRLVSIEEHINKRLNMEKKVNKPQNILRASQESLRSIQEICSIINQLFKNKSLKASSSK